VPAGGALSASRSLEPSAVVDLEDMEEEETGMLSCCGLDLGLCSGLLSGWVCQRSLGDWRAREVYKGKQYEKLVHDLSPDCKLTGAAQLHLLKNYTFSSEFCSIGKRGTCA